MEITIKKNLVLLLITAMIISTTIMPIFASEGVRQDERILTSEDFINNVAETVEVSGVPNNVQLGTEYTVFMESRCSKGEFPSMDDVQDFVEYAVANNIIDDTQASRGAVTKAVVRASLKILATGADGLGWDLAAALLNHSLQDNPSDLYYKGGSFASTDIFHSDVFQSNVNRMVKKVKASGKLSDAEYGQVMYLNDNNNLLLALNKVEYDMTVKKQTDGKWRCDAVIRDTYNFEKQDWAYADGITGAMAGALNNYGAYAYSTGAINDYDITIEAAAIHD